MNASSLFRLFSEALFRGSFPYPSLCSFCVPVFISHIVFLQSFLSFRACFLVTFAFHFCCLFPASHFSSFFLTLAFTKPFQFPLCSLTHLCFSLVQISYIIKYFPSFPPVTLSIIISRKEKKKITFRFFCFWIYLFFIFLSIHLRAVSILASKIN